MNKRGHKADFELRENEICRVVIVYKPGIQVVRVFSSRGLNLDGTFMKHEFGGTLLVACLKNSNNEIQIVAVAWVSGETKDNWAWFLSHLCRLTDTLAFVISDHDKGLVPAMQVETGAVPHFVCVWHILENINAKFRNVALKNQAWKLATSLSVASFNRRADEMVKNNPKALEWLLEADKRKWSAAFSLCPRYGTMTSNNVESINNVLLEENKNALGLSHGNRNFERKRLASVVDKIEIIPSCLSSFVVKVCKEGELQVQYAIDIDDHEKPCSCGYSNYMKAPRAHLIAALRSVNKLSLVKDFYDETWTTEAYKRAYDPLEKMSPCVTKDDLTRFERRQPPPVPKKRGRPKKSTKRIESQGAIEALKAKRKVKCGQCGNQGHNKRTCKS